MKYLKILVLRSSQSKILKQVEYESARRNKYVNEEQEKERNKSQHFLISHLFLTTQGNSMELVGT